MKIKTIWLVALVALFSAPPVFAETKSKEALAQMAVSADPAVSTEAVRNLRALGSEGLETLFQIHAGEIAKFTRDGAATDDWLRLAAALDAVAMQKDAYAANLFWFTDFEEAKREAERTNKPILSLRLLGNLNEEFSCANSRFFRALLYSNAGVSKFLRENYVLHWKSVRPAPRVTIDFGDGRRIERTVTGNSIHYILDRNGAIVDALPGLYAPWHFLNYLKSGREFGKTLLKLPELQKRAALNGYRRERFDRLDADRRDALELSKVKLIEPVEPAKAPDAKPTALDAAPLAVTKMSTEIRILNAINDNFPRYAPQLDLDAWKKLSKSYAGTIAFDEASVAFIKRQNRELSDAEFAALLSNLTNYVALDTTRNDFLFHAKLYEWLNRQSAKPPELESFNSRVYAELFKTPASDKWLGLYESDVYTALDGNGIIK